MAYLPMVLIMKALSVNIEKVWSCLLASSARVIAASSARFMVCLSGCDFIYICVVIWVLGLTMDAPRVGFPVTREPSVYMNSVGFHAAWYGRMWDGLFGEAIMDMEG
jgi:hypothetical protein